MGGRDSDQYSLYREGQDGHRGKIGYVESMTSTAENEFLPDATGTPPEISIMLGADL